MKKFTLSLVAVVALGWASGCDGGSSDGGGGNAGTGTSSGGTGSSSGGKSGSGGLATGGSGMGGATGGSNSGTGGSAQNGDVAAFCTKYEADCGFSGTNAARFASSAACLEEAGAIEAENAPRFACMVDHLEYVTSMSSPSHCAHAKGGAPCSETEFPN